jgi:hypothetical protein
LLRAYKASLTSSNSQWDGFGNGRLTTGVGADGSGVTVQYLSQCASALSTGAGTTSGAPNPTSTGHGHSPSGSSNQTYKTSLLHKLLAALSLIILQAIVLIFRNPIRSPFTYICVAGGLGAYGLGVAGFVLAFSTISISSALDATLPSSPHLHTAHGIAGLVFFLCLYVFAPLWLLISASTSRLRSPPRGPHQSPSDQGPTNSVIVAEEKSDQITGPSSRSAPQSIHDGSPPSSPRPRTQSWVGFSSDTESVTCGVPRGFEVVNRPPRLRQTSGNTGPAEIPRPASRSLGEIDWLLRRRSLNLVVR